MGMADTLLRNVDEDLIAEYRAAARANGRSLNAELQEGLKRARPTRGRTKSELLALSRSLTESGPLTSDSTLLIREMRDTDGGRYLGGERPDADRH
jgi:plasmid stability protein